MAAPYRIPTCFPYNNCSIFYAPTSLSYLFDFYNTNAIYVHIYFKISSNCILTSWYLQKTHINQQLSRVKLQIHLHFNLKITTSSPTRLKLLFHLTYLTPYRNVKIPLYLPPITLLPPTPSLKTEISLYFNLCSA